MRIAQHIAIIIPLANEASTFAELILQLQQVLERITNAEVFFVVDTASKDATKLLCEQASASNASIHCIYAPDNKNVVDAYLAGFKAAYSTDCDLFIEMDGGLAHHPTQIINFVNAYQNGYDCVFGSRFMEGGALVNARFIRRFFSKAGTKATNLLLGTRLKDMTSGFEAFDRTTMQSILEFPLRSKAHFYQTELRYLCRRKKQIELPIIHRSPAPHLKFTAIKNAVGCLFYYFFKRLGFQAPRF